MPTRDDILKDLMRRVKALEDWRESQLDSWDQEMGDEAQLAAEHFGKRPVEDKGIYMEGDTLVIPPPTDEQDRMRAAAIQQGVVKNLIGEDKEPLPITEQDAMVAYRKGGPAWLYSVTREHVVGLPRGLRELMVKDVHLTDTEYALRMGRDILKDFDDDALRSAEFDRAANEMDLRIEGVHR